MKAEINLPDYVRTALAELEAAGFEAVVVGGCVRDSLLGRIPGDWDIATSAIPEEVKRVFDGRRIIETGLKHGTVTVLFDSSSLEITTYRVDGEYSDGRRPDFVNYTRDLAQDLARRDFTVNALAYSPGKGIVDRLGGVRDLEARLLRCVGNPHARFIEDGLRIMRAVRFSATLGFVVEDTTAAAMCELAGLLSNVSPERLGAELNKALTGKYIEAALVSYGYVFAKIIPELEPMFGFCQHTRYHHLDVWEHTAKAVSEIQPDVTKRLAMLLHDIGKPNTFTLGKGGEGHFYGHGSVGAEIADRVLAGLKYDNRTREEVVYLVKHHCDELKPEPKHLRRLLNRMGEPLLRNLLAVNIADCKAQAPEFSVERVRYFKSVETALDIIIEENQVFSLKNLAVNGHDLIEAGFSPGKELGAALDVLLARVMDETLPNEKEALIKAAQLL